MANDDRLILIHCSCPDTVSAGRIANALVEEHLAACVQAIGGVTSTYRWQGNVESCTEVLLVIKTVATRFEAVRARIVAMHPYELPEIIAVDSAGAHAPYLDWVRTASSTGSVSS
ncbi:MAG: divalent-cation tolerance protein CutA [Dokdonella sp.]